MQLPVLLLALIAVLVRPVLAHDCPCECPKADSDDSGDIIVEEVTDDLQEPAEPVVEEKAPTAPHYAAMQEIFVGRDGVITIVLGEATPNFLIDRALNEKGIENEWLAPLSCAELDRVEDALYARHKVDFEDDADEAFFAAATVGVYTPVPNLTREGAEHFFTSQDKLTQLRVDRAQGNKSCSE